MQLGVSSLTHVEIHCGADGVSHVFYGAAGKRGIDEVEEAGGDLRERPARKSGARFRRREDGMTDRDVSRH